MSLKDLQHVACFFMSRVQDVMLVFDSRIEVLDTKQLPGWLSQMVLHQHAPLHSNGGYQMFFCMSIPFPSSTGPAVCKCVKLHLQSSPIVQMSKQVSSFTPGYHCTACCAIFECWHAYFAEERYVPDNILIHNTWQPKMSDLKEDRCPKWSEKDALEYVILPGKFQWRALKWVPEDAHQLHQLHWEYSWNENT